MEMFYENFTILILNESAESPNVAFPEMNISVVNSVSAINNSVVPVKHSGGFSSMEKHVIVPLYSIIFLLSFSGNLLVLLTLARNKRMRTVTNVYLLNLALSDLLLGVFCMPFTLVGQLLRNFIFGATMCKLIPYFQAVSVSVGVWTLVAISLERYFAICRPLESRRWQTRKHAFKMIITVWICSLLWNTPILVVSTLQAMKSGHYKCREQWPSAYSERFYNLFLDVVLLILPLVIMSLAYSLIVGKLWRGLKLEIGQNNMTNNMLLIQGIRRSDSFPTNNMISETQENNQINISKSENSKYDHELAVGSCSNKTSSRSKPRNCKQKTSKDKDNFAATKAVKLWLLQSFAQVKIPKRKSRKQFTRDEPEITTSNNVTSHYTFTRQAIRSNYMCKSIEAKKKVIRMLFVIIVEFFICWAPLHVLNTVYLFCPKILYNHVGPTGVALVQLLAYVSACCNPITYCFMNRRFREAFLRLFPCRSRCRSTCTSRHNLTSSHSNDVRCGDIIARSGDVRMVTQNNNDRQRSEIVILEAEDRV